MKKRCIQEWLDLWGEWERAGSNYTKHLQPKSCMLSLGGAVVVRIDAPPPPNLSDDDARFICSVMAKIKSESPYNYRVLRLRYLNGLSVPRLKAFLKVGQDKCYELLGAAELLAEETIQNCINSQPVRKYK